MNEGSLCGAITLTPRQQGVEGDDATTQKQQHGAKRSS